jgi:putative addiction module CopG family antidote
MSENGTRTIELPADLAEFAQRQLDTGRYGSLVEVVREAFQLLLERGSRVAELRKELDIGIAQLDLGRSTRSTPREMMDGIRAELGLAREP